MAWSGGIKTTVLALVWACGIATLVSAQDFPVYRQDLPVASLNSGQLFSRSQAGAAFLEQSRKRSTALAEENRRIESELEQEELNLTEMRKTLPAEQFRALADAFDAKVVTIRREQIAKAAALTQDLELARQKFSAVVQPILQQFMQERGIIFILNEQAIILANIEGDITDEMVARVDAAIGATLDTQE